MGKKKKKWLLFKVILGVGILVVIVLVAGAIVIANIKSIILAKLRSAFPELNISVGEVALTPFSKIRINDIAITDKRDSLEKSRIKIEELNVDFAIKSLKRINLKNIRLDNEEIVLDYSDENFRPFAGSLSRENGPASPLRIKNVRLRNCKISLTGDGYRLRSVMNLKLRSPLEDKFFEDGKMEIELKDFVWKSANLETANLNVEFKGTYRNDIEDQRTEFGDSYLKVNDVESGVRGYIDNKAERAMAVFDFELKSIPINDILDLFKSEIPVFSSFDIDGEADSNFRLVVEPGAAEFLRMVGNAYVPDSTADSSYYDLHFKGITAVVPFEYRVSTDGYSWKIGDETKPLNPGRAAAKEIRFKKYVVTDYRSDMSYDNEAWKLDNIICRGYQGEIRGCLKTFYEQDVTNYSTELKLYEFNLKNFVDIFELEKFEITGLIDGKISLQGAGKKIRDVHGYFRSITPGGIIQIGDLEKFLNSLPEGDKTTARLKRELKGKWKVFVESMRNYLYTDGVAHIGFSGNNIVLLFLLNGPTGMRNFSLSISLVYK